MVPNVDDVSLGPGVKAPLLRKNGRLRTRWSSGTEFYWELPLVFSQPEGLSSATRSNT